MRVKMTFAALALTALALGLPATAAAGGSREPVRVVATGLNDPRGIDARESDHGDRLLVTQSGSGEITEILARRKGDPEVGAFATLANTFVSDVVAHGYGSAFVTAGREPEAGGDPFAGVLQVPRGGDDSLLADIAAYQVGDPDPVDQEDAPEESNPFGLALLRHGLLVADAANNDLLKIRKNGSIETVARFPTRTVPFPEGAPDGPPAGTPVESEAVPTAVAVGPDGAWYVSELRGFPFTRGASRIWRIEPGAEDAKCDPDAKRGPCRVYADGFTSVIDLTFANGTLLVLEIAKEGLLEAETGGGPPVGGLWAVQGGSKTEIAAGSLLAPGGVSVADDERIYVTTGTVFGPGAGEVVRIHGALEDEEDERGDGKGHHGDRDHKGDKRGDDNRKHAKHKRDRKQHKKHRRGDD